MSFLLVTLSISKAAKQNSKITQEYAPKCKKWKNLEKKKCHTIFDWVLQQSSDWFLGY